MTENETPQLENIPGITTQAGSPSKIQNEAQSESSSYEVNDTEEVISHSKKEDLGKSHLPSPNLFSQNLFISAGEASGDNHGADVIRSLKILAKDKFKLSIWGMGGSALKDEGIEILQDSSNLGIIGIADVIKKLPQLWRLENNLINEIKKRKPDVALLIDYPGLNMRLAAKIKKLVPHCKVIFYIAPQVWAWNSGRIRKIPKIVDRLLTILPFEEKLHQEAGTSAKFVGNPSAWVINQLKDLDQDEVIRYMGLNPDKPVIGIFPGSRDREIDFMLPVLLESAKALKAKNPKVQFLLIKAPTISQEKIDKFFKLHQISDDLIKVKSAEKNTNLFVLQSVDFAWLTSGTVTLEAACALTPLILGYRENPIFWRGYLFVRQISQIGLPNIIAGEEVCTELLQENCTPEKWVEITEKWLSSEEKVKATKELLKTKVKDVLETAINPADRVAGEILTIHKINYASLENQIYMREQAQKNSQESSSKAHR